MLWDISHTNVSNQLPFLLRFLQYQIVTKISNSNTKAPTKATAIISWSVLDKLISLSSDECWFVDLCCTGVLEVSALIVEIIVVSWVVGITIVVCEDEVTTVVGSSKAEAVVENADVPESCDIYVVADLIIYINMTASTKVFQIKI